MGWESGAPTNRSGISVVDVIRAEANVQWAADFLTATGEEGSPFSGGVAGRDSSLAMLAAEHRLGASRCREHQRPPSLGTTSLCDGCSVTPPLVSLA